jgi:hypothetical protein
LNITGDSLIEEVKAAAGLESLVIVLDYATPELVGFSTVLDLTTTGWVLTADDTSPAELTIDGGGRVIDLAGAPPRRPSP